MNEQKYETKKFYVMNREGASNEEKVRNAFNAVIDYARALGVRLENEYNEGLSWVEEETVERFNGDPEEIVQFVFNYRD